MIGLYLCKYLELCIEFFKLQINKPTSKIFKKYLNDVGVNLAYNSLYLKYF